MIGPLCSLPRLSGRTRQIHPVWPWHEHRTCFKQHVFLRVSVSSRLLRFIYLGCIWSHVRGWLVSFTQRLSHTSLDHISLQRPVKRGQHRETSTERSDGGISGFQPCCQSRYEQPLLGRACLKPNSTTSLKASGSPAGLHSVPRVTTNFPSAPSEPHHFSSNLFSLSLWPLQKLQWEKKIPVWRKKIPKTTVNWKRNTTIAYIVKRKHLSMKPNMSPLYKHCHTCWGATVVDLPWRQLASSVCTIMYHAVTVTDSERFSGTITGNTAAVKRNGSFFNWKLNWSAERVTWPRSPWKLEWECVILSVSFQKMFSCHWGNRPRFISPTKTMFSLWQLHSEGCWRRHSCNI